MFRHEKSRTQRCTAFHGNYSKRDNMSKNWLRRFFWKQSCELMVISHIHRSTWWRSWLRHSVTSRKVAGSIPDGVIGIFHGHNPSGPTMALGLTQPLKKMVPGIFPRGKDGRCVGLTTLPPSYARADNLTTFMCRLSWNLGASTSWNPLGLSRPEMGLLYL